MPNIIFEIGDRSGEDHGFSTKFVVSSNLTLDVLRSVHLKENKFIGRLYSEYTNSRIKLAVFYEFFTKYMPQESALNQLREISKLPDVGIEADLMISDEELLTIIDEKFLEPKNFTGILEIWLKLLKAIEPSFEYTVLSKDGCSVGYEHMFLSVEYDMNPIKKPLMDDVY